MVKSSTPERVMFFFSFCLIWFFFSCNLLCFAIMFCIDVSFFISIISFFISFISFDNTQKTIYRTAKKTSFHSPSLAVSVELS